MPDAITSPDIADLARLHLSGRLGVAVYADVTPPDFPVESVTITRVGGARTHLVMDVARLSLDVRAAKPSRALFLARVCVAEMLTAAMVGDLAGTPCYRAIELSAPYINPDPRNTSLVRFTALIEVAARCSVS